MYSKSGLIQRLVREGRRCFSSNSPPTVSWKNHKNIQLLRKIKRAGGNHYIFDSELAAFIANTIKKESDNVDTMIEINPGIGVMSKEFAKVYDRLIVVEKTAGFLRSIQELKKTTKNMEIQDDNNDYFAFDTLSGFRYLTPPEVLDVIPKTDNHSDIVANAFIVIPQQRERNFARVLTRSALVMDGIYNHGRLNVFAFVPSLFLRRLDYVKHTFSLKVKFELELFLDLKFLTEIDLNSVFPTYHRTKGRAKNTVENLHLIKLTPKPNIDQILKYEDVDQYHLFSKQMLRMPDKRIIPRMEEYFPNCGIFLIDKGYNMMQRFIDLNAEEFLELFKLLPTIPDYEYSLWRQYVKSESLMDDDKISWSETH